MKKIIPLVLVLAMIFTIFIPVNANDNDCSFFNNFGLHYFHNGSCLYCGLVGNFAEEECISRYGYHSTFNNICTRCGIEGIFSPEWCVIAYGYHDFINNICTRCGVTPCSLYGFHDFDYSGKCTRCEITDCRSGGSHQFSNDKCILCGIPDCSVYAINGNHEFGTYNSNGYGYICTRCGIPECAVNSGYHVGDTGDSDCINCGVPVCFSGNHYFIGGRCKGCGIAECGGHRYNDHTGLIKCIDCGYEEWQHDYIGCNYGHDFYHIDNTQKCRRCGVPACFVGWDGHDYDHQFGEVHCIRCGNKDWIDEPIITCEDIGRHDFEDGMCFRCGELDWNDCRWGSGNHNFVNGYCTRCWEYECYSGNHNFVNGDCRYCGEPDWNDCRYGSGNHSFVNSECISCWENTCSLYGIHLFELHVQPHWCKFCGEKNNDYDCILYGHNFMNNECIFCWENSCSLYGIHYLENNECKFCGGNSCSLHGIHEVDFIAGVCRYCGEYGCSVYGEHYFLRGLCWYCGENSCSLCGEHYFEYGECKFCGEYGCDSTDGEHYFEYGSCRYCGKDVCSFYGEHHFGYGVGGRVCIYCGETDWNDCRWGSGNHNFVGGYCISCGEPDYFGDCRFGYANHNYEYLDHGNHIDYRCVNCGDYMCENPNNPEITSIEVNKDNSIYEIKEENKGVWNIVFYIKVTYDDGSIEYVPTIIEIDKNSSGQIDFGDYILEYDIKGNGSNIKKFDIIMK